jgi:nitrogen fixation NifU-like protein
MQNRTFYNEILTEHNLHPEHKHPLINPTASQRGVNPSCGDDVTLQLSIGEDGVIEDGAFIGDGCAISQASADMMLDLIIGSTKEEALAYAERFMNMVRSTATPEEIESLDEAASLEDISHMPARVKCATLGWKTMQRMLRDGESEGGSRQACEGCTT